MKTLTFAILLLGQFSLALSTRGAGQVVTLQNTPIGFNLTNVVQIASSLALRADGTVIDLQSGSSTGVTQAVAIAVGQSSLALRSDGTVIAWGDNTYGQTNVPSGLSSIVAIAVGWQHSIALKSDGTVIAWGDNSFGQTNVPVGLSGVVQIAAARYYSLALKADGSVVAWGDSLEKDVPPGLGPVVRIAACGHNNLALKEDGSVVGWGNYLSMCVDLHCLVPVFVPPGLSNVVAIGGDDFHSLALDSKGIVTGWDPRFTDTVTWLQPVSAIAAGTVYGDLAIVGAGPPIIRALLANVMEKSSGFSCSIPTQSGRVYRLEYTDRLTGGAWLPLPLVAGNGGLQTLTDPSTGATLRFYRVRAW